MTSPTTAAQVHLENVHQWRAWLADHAATAGGVWLVSWRKPTGRPAIGYEDAVLVALAYGWIDSRQVRLDEQRSMLYFSPRLRGSGWARTNKLRIERLRREGRMTPAGERIIAEAQADGSWTLLDEVEDLVVPPDLADALAAHPAAADHWAAFPPSTRRRLLEWIVQARQPSTRRRRVEQTAVAAAVGKPALP